MSITVEIPDELAKQFPTKEAASRELLEAYAAEAYRTRRMSHAQVGRLLGLDRWGTEALLTKRNALREFTIADYEMEGPPPK
jgi:hypothetical protein